MRPITTSLTRILGIRSPIILAPMAFGTVLKLPSIVSGKGGFGFIGAGFASSELIKGNLQTIRDELHIADDQPVPVGVGFIGWVLDKTEVSDDPRIPAVLASRPKAVWFGFGDDLGKHIAVVKKINASSKDHKTLIFVIVYSVEDAHRAVDEWGADVLVVQGHEAGGHGGSHAPPLFMILPEIISSFPSERRPHIVAAGGIATGKQIAALLTMGVSGVALGTRFLFTHESPYNEMKRGELIKAGWGSTQRGFMFDEVNRTMGWPEKNDGRAIANDIMSDFDAGLSLEERMKRHDESAAKGETNRLVIWAGVGVALTKELKSTAVRIPIP
ncbi:hypothetical protein ONZ45_g16804 [Pleurotus djamor]|nr:hypothetical protein ONZ45_g16804 [Pleurotus djamor]